MLPGAHAGAVLYAVTGDGAAVSESLYTLDTSDASATFVTALGNGDDGEALAFNPDDGLMYHWSGIGDSTTYFESIDLNTLDVTNIYTSAIHGEILSAAYDPSCMCFLAYDNSELFYSINTAGIVTVLDFLGRAPADNMKGLAFVGSTLYGGGGGGGGSSDQLFTIDPSTGAGTGSVTITSALGSVGAVMGLSVNPDTTDLYAILKISGNRRLAIIDPLTGAATDIGLLADNYSSIAFVPPEIRVVEIDVHPRRKVSRIPAHSFGLLPVLVRSTSIAQGDDGDFDAMQIDPSTLRLDGAPSESESSDNHIVSFSIYDFDRDGDQDLLAIFRTRQTSIECDDTEAILSGATYAGEPITGSDAIQTVACKRRH